MENKPNIIKALEWRYAAKRMNGKKISAEKLENILEAIRLSASSRGLQPYTIIVISNDELKKKIQTAANNQPQVGESSDLLVFAAWTDITGEKIDEFINDISGKRGVSVESLSLFREKMKSSISSSPEKNFNSSARQAYIALGTALAAAAEEKIDASPMEGFNPDAVDEILNLKDKGLKSVVLLALGYRDEENDPFAHAKKVRRDKEKLFIRYN